MTFALILMIVGMTLVPTGDTAGKLLVASYGVAPVVVAWARFSLGAVLTLPLAPHQTWAMLRDWRVWGRGVSLTLGVVCILSALQTAPIASVFATFFIGPILSVMLSAWWIKEPVGPARAALLALGFAGVLLVVRPGFDAPPGLGFAVLAGVFYALYLTSSRALAHYPPRGLILTQMLPGTIVLAPFAIGGLPEMSWDVAALFVASGVSSALGNFLLIIAYGMASAAALAPMVYFQLVAATALGWLVFGDVPDGLTWAGLALIVVAGVTSARLNRPASSGPDFSGPTLSGPTQSGRE